MSDKPIKNLKSKCSVHTAATCRSTGYMYPKAEHVQLLDACSKKSTFDSGYRRHVADMIHFQRFGYRRHVEGSVHTGVTCRILHVECKGGKCLHCTCR